ncbi:MAG: glycoside hydrolase family 65, partial [Defluviitaleaceae bacterium]|nr:glycoside hydrolase family 65 [Defluviitaleaceae bacterium]
LPDMAIELLLMESPKNDYVKSGNNFQRTGNDLPLYLPGNGSLLLALAIMTAGFDGSEPMPGIPKDGLWEIEFENIDKLM